MGELADRRVVVTGAAAGIGEATVVACARSGADVLAVDVAHGLTELPARVRSSVAEGEADLIAGRVETRVVDLCDTAAVEAFASELSAGARVDALVNCAAAYPPGGLFTSAASDWARVLQVNVVAAATLTRAVAERWVSERLAGAIVNVGSVQEQLPLPGYAPYVTTKGALGAMTRALAVELGQYGIRVNQVAPGVVNSPSMMGVLGGADWESSGQSAPTLLERAGTPAEVADLVVYLASDRASYVTGAEIPVDGGRRLSRRYDPQVDPNADNAVSQGLREAAARGEEAADAHR